MFLRKVFFVVVIMCFFVSCGELIEMINYKMEYDDEAKICFIIESKEGLLYDVPRIVRFFDTNPNTPNDLSELWNTNETYSPYKYYKIKPGQYYLEYVHENNAAYYMFYEIKIYRPSWGSKEWDSYQYMGGNLHENDHYIEFEVWLHSTGPSLWGGKTDEPEKGEIQKSSLRSINNEIYENRGPIIEKLEKKVDGGSIVMEYGMLY